MVTTRPAWGAPLFRSCALFALLCCTLLPALQVLAAAVPKDRAVLAKAMVTEAPPSIKLFWPVDDRATQYVISRKLVTDANWGTPLTTITGEDAAASTEYIDRGVTQGVAYEYKIQKTLTQDGTVTAYGYVCSGIKVPAVENRGTLILVVDASMADELTLELTRLKADLIGDGWQVIRHDVARDATPPQVKALITADYTANPTGVKAVLLFGHVAIAKSGNINPDGHGDHLGPWPTDIYYADMDGMWTDTTDYSEKNRPGDGNFDQSNPPSEVELLAGRVDLYSLPVYEVTETELLRRYLNKDHNYRVKTLTAEPRALIDDNFQSFAESFSASGWRAYSTFYGADNVQELDWNTTLPDNTYQWAYGCGGGTYTSAAGVANSTDLATNDPKAIFTCLFGSYHGDWANTNNFMRTMLGTETAGLTCAWSGRPHWFFHHMGMGYPIGYSTFITQNNRSSVYPPGYTGIQVSLLGDPTLRLHIIAPASELNATLEGPNVRLSWTASTETVLGYYVYRATSADGPYARITPTLVTGTSYTDSTSLPGLNYYMVRAVQLESAASGSYYNLSTGIFASCTGNPAGGLPAPLLTYPAAGANNIPIPVTVRWSAVSGAATYSIQVASDEGFTTLAADLTGVTGTSKSITGLLPGTRYWWRVRGMSPTKTGSWSAVRSFTTKNIPVLGAPILTSPSNGASNVPNPPVRLIWQAVSGATGYVLQVSARADFATTIVNTDSIRGTVAEIRYLAKNTTYYWRVRAYSATMQGGWSTVWSFTTLPGDTPPIATTLLTPADVATNVARPVRFTWSVVPDAQTYWLQVARDAAFTNLMANISALRVTTYEVRNLSAGTRYYWRVKTVNARGLSVWSEVWSFTTQANITLPAAPRLLSPATGAAGVNRPVTCTWSAVSGATDYQVQVSTTSTFVTVVAEAAPAGPSTVFSSLLGGTRYYWRVRAMNAAGPGAWSSTGYFTTKTGAGDPGMG